MARTKASAPEVARDTYVQPIDRPNGPWDDYDLKGFLRTLTEAEKIRKNRGLMCRLRTEANKQLSALQSIAK